jgi:pimeloyl-ACP methyl ester carboxylesterase
VDGNTILLGYCLGGAALALWLLVRFPDLGPRRLISVIAAVVAVAVALAVSGPVFAALVDRGRLGASFGLLLVVLPALTLAFWVSGCVLRALADLPGLRR